jgi:hypothetical protein
MNAKMELNSSFKLRNKEMMMTSMSLREKQSEFVCFSYMLFIEIILDFEIETVIT